MAFSLVVLIFIFVIGLVFGSFLNVVILRTVSEESIVLPASKCPKCQTPLKWYHNIPLLSYVFLRGKCAFCKEHISVQYPIVELLTGILFVGLFLKVCSPFDKFFGLSVMYPIGWEQVITYVFMLIVTCLFIVLAGTDIIEKRVADVHTISLIVIGFLYSIIFSVFNISVYTMSKGAPELNLNLVMTCPILFSIGAGILGFLVMEAFSRLGIILVGARAFGEGDSYIMAGIGAVLGAYVGFASGDYTFTAVVKYVLEILVLAGLLQALVALPMFVKKLFVNKNWITLGTFVTFIIYAVGFVFAQVNDWLVNPAAYWTCALVLAALGLWTCREILCGVKLNQQEWLYLPFGPALVFSALVVFFVL